MVPPESPPASPQNPPPPPIADYELLRLIGRGSYGDVWLARGVTGVFRAVKIVWRDRFPDIRPYEREFEGITRFAAISLREPSQLALLHAGRQDAAGFFYYVMELADDTARGREIDPTSYTPSTLKDFSAQRGGRLDIAEVVALGTALARALASLHAAGLVHRDIKPSNVIIVGGVPKLADVGLVALASAQLTFVGTEGFVPPEGTGAPAADVYSLGKLLYELATGLDRHDWPRLPPDLDTRPDQRALLELNEVLVRACEPDARQRFPDAAALLDELLLLQAGKSVRRLRSAERRLARALRFAAVLAIIAGLAGAGAWVEHKRAAKAEAERSAQAWRSTYSGNLASAQRALGNGDLARARKLLSELAPKRGAADLRDFEWHALWFQAQGDPHDVARPSGTDAINRLALSPDESLLAAHDKKLILVIYDAISLSEIRRISDMNLFGGFSSDGLWIVGTDSSKALRRWAVRDGTLDNGTKGPDWKPIAAQGLNRVVAVSDGPPIRIHVWDYSENREIHRAMLPDAAGSPAWKVFRTGASADGTVAVVASVRGVDSEAQFRLTYLPTAGAGEPQHREIGRIRPSAVGVGSSGAWAVADTSGAVWRYVDGNWTESAEKFPSGTLAFRELADGETARGVAAANRDLVWLKQAGDLAITRSGHAHAAPIADLIVSSRRNVVFSAGTDGSLFRWPRIAPPKSFRAWNSNGGATRAIFLADSKTVWVPADGTSCVRLAVADFEILGRTHGMRFPLRLTNRGLIGVGSDTGLVRVNPSTGDMLEHVLTTVKIKTAAVTSDGGRGAAIDVSGNLWTLSEGEPRIVGGGFERYYSIALDQSGDRLCLTDSERHLQCLAWPGGDLLWSVRLPALAPTLAFSPDEKTLIVALTNGTLEIRDLASGDLQMQVDSVSAALQSLAFNPSGTRLFAAGFEGQIRCFDPATWDEIHAMSLGPNVRPHSLVCSPDGAAIICLTKTGELLVLRTR